MEEVEEQQYSLTTNDAIKALATMKCRHMTACWTCFVGKSSVVIVESDYNDSICNEIIQEIRNHYDKLKPHKPKSITGIRSRMSELLMYSLNQKLEIWEKYEKLLEQQGI